MDTVRPDAFVLLGGFGVVCRNPLYLEELSRQGLRILLITPSGWREDAEAAMADPEHPASAVSDVAFVDGQLGVEGSFTAAVIGRALQWRDTYNIVGVYAVGEILVEQAGLLADALGRRGPGLRATRVCRSKYLQRWYLREWSPRSLVVSPEHRGSLDPSTVTFPVVVKPSGRHSSSGVTASWDPSDLKALVASYPPHETLLIEQKVTGQEYSVESLTQNGEVCFSSITRKETTESGARTFVELSHSVPGVIGDAESEQLRAANQAVLKALDFRDGIAHSEWRIGDDRRPYLMEIAARTPGDGLVALYELATGRSMESEILRIALGQPASYPRPTRYTRQVYLEHRPGVLNDVTLNWPGVEPAWVGESGIWPRLVVGRPDDPPTLRAVLVLKDRFTELRTPRESDDRAVAFFVDAPTPEELDLLEKRVRAAISIETTDPAG